jgi:dipeptidyl aminopeptidase/acylaminoacyl peptidase
LLVVQAQNDPRVPVAESEQMVRAVCDNGGSVGYLLARDEGHGFRKEQNADYRFLTTIHFLRIHLLEKGE